MTGSVVDCFTYGSLMCPDIMEAVTGEVFTAQPARLTGYRRHPVKGEEYPGIVAAPGHEVEGVLYRRVGAAALARLDAFEGDMYLRTTVAVTLADGSRTVADVYVFRPEYGHLLEPGNWDFRRFLAEGKRRFERTYVGFARS